MASGAPLAALGGMKHFLLFSLLFAVPLFAQQSDNVILPLEYNYQLLIPVAGNTPGANGTFFKSDINIINLRAAEQRIRLRWLPQGRTGVDIPAKEMTIAAASGFFSEDFVANVMEQTGLGAIQIVGIRSDGQPDVDARLYATSRIWTPHPVAGGTVSQTFPTLTMTTRSDAPPKWIFGVRRDDRYRLNVGIVNYSGIKQSFTVQTGSGGPVPGGETVLIQVEPFSIVQAGITGQAQGAFQIIVRNDSGSALWDAWASSIDNVTGDAWSEIAFNIPAGTNTTP
jgi:hypothetical protein